MKLNVTINGKRHSLEIAPNALLLDVLRTAGLKSVKKGCGEGHCGACAVMINGRPRNACLVFAAHCEGATLLTAEGMGTPEQPHLLQESFVKHGATQCGFCNPGSLIAAKALLDRLPNPSEIEVKEALDGNLCRCTGYVKRIEAVLDAAKIAKDTSRSI
jgi:aerobic-type carbon monoxide dehydrogenase small subunit (CoxS/CutS family)